MTIKLIEPEWDAPSNIKAFTTTRVGGFSQGIYEGLNLALHVGDDQETVLKNRELLPLPEHSVWLDQVHGTDCLRVTNPVIKNKTADAVFTSNKKIACIVMSADCLPILLTDIIGSFVAAVHAGWRGLLDGIIEKQISQIESTSELIAWIGPAISQQYFEVGDEVFRMFLDKNENDADAFKLNHRGKYQLDIPSLAKKKLNQLGVKKVTGGNLCTFAEIELFYSYRRDGVTGRMASCVWIE